jgi:hypothetical protein
VSARTATLVDPIAYQSEAWRDVPTWQLYLVPFEDGDSEDADDVSLPSLDVVAAALATANASVLSYLPPAALLAAVGPGRAEDLSATGIQLVRPLLQTLVGCCRGSTARPSCHPRSAAPLAVQIPYGSEHRRDPSLEPLLAVLASKGAAAPNSQASPTASQTSGGWRRRLSGGAQRSLADGGDGEAAAQRAAALQRFGIFSPDAVPHERQGEAHEQRRRRSLAADAAPPPQYELWATLRPGLGAGVLRAAEDDWPGALAAALPSQQGGDGGGSEGEPCWPLVSVMRDQEGGLRAPQDGGSGALLRVFACEQVGRRAGPGGLRCMRA